MPKNIIIVGAPRSGTSLTARIFTQKGYFVTADESNDLQEANEFNPYGFWESAGLRNCNAELFESIGFPFLNTWLHERITEDQAMALLDQEPTEKHRNFVSIYNTHQPWMWKDPNLCYTVNYWWKLMDPEQTGVLFLRRDPEDICHSFVRLRWCQNTRKDRASTLERINHHMDFAEKTLKTYGIPHLFVNYRDYERDADATAAKIADYFDIELSGSDLGFEKKLNTSKANHLIWINAFSDLMPPGLMRFLKKLIPQYVFKKLFPSRYIDRS